MRWLFLAANAILFAAGMALCIHDATEPCFRALALMYLSLINFVVYGVVRVCQALKARESKKRLREVMEHEPPE